MVILKLLFTKKSFLIIKEYSIYPVLHSLIIFGIPLFYVKENIFNVAVFCWVTTLLVDLYINITCKSIYLATLLFILMLYFYLNFYLVKELSVGASFGVFLLFILYILPICIVRVIKSK